MHDEVQVERPSASAPDLTAPRSVDLRCARRTLDVMFAPPKPPQVGKPARRSRTKAVDATDGTRPPTQQAPDPTDLQRHGSAAWRGRLHHRSGTEQSKAGTGSDNTDTAEVQRLASDLAQGECARCKSVG